ncbi:MAG: hypothetical protein RBT76_03095 [candidate division Zixibacteria bacterium]|jgi:anti-sigma factor RsiW|nr:hypothetical protein [candidate division Zixibacteria bacterium]
MSVERLTDERIFDYLDGNLSAEERQAVEWLIALSEENRALVGQYRELYGQLGTRQVYSVPPSFEHAVLEQIEMARRQRRWFTRLTAAALAACGTAAVLILGSMLDLSPVAAWLVQMLPELPSAADVASVCTESAQACGAVIGSLGSGSALFAFAGAILVGFHMLDSALVRSHFRSMSES